MNLRQLFEAEVGGKHLTFCFGRMNPPTIGHKQLLDTCAGVGGDYKIFVSTGERYEKDAVYLNDMSQNISSMTQEINATVEEINKAVQGMAGSVQNSVKNTNDILGGLCHT